jgi:hypothetical protein
MQTDSKKMLRFEHTTTDGVGGILAELGGVKMRIKVPKLDIQQSTRAGGSNGMWGAGAGGGHEGRTMTTTVSVLSG